MKKIGLLTVVVLACGFVYAGKYAASVNGEKITKTQVEKRLWSLFGQRITDEFVMEKLILQAADKHKVTADKKEVEKQYKQIKAQYPSEKEFKEVLKKRNLTEAEVKNQVKLKEITNNLVLKIEKIKITDKMTKDFFDKNKKSFETPERVHLKQIVVKTKKEAEVILGMLKRNKKSFETLAKEKSLDKQSALKGGDIGLIAKDQLIGDVSKEIFGMKKGKYTLKIGQYTNIIDTPSGHYILKLQNRLPKKPAQFAKVENVIKENILRTEISKGMPKVIEKLKKEAKIEYYI